MQFQQLAYFLAVAETRHFTRAAELSRVAQPSLSKQIRNLEEELGAALFSRARGNITLTPAGEALLPLAQRILTDMETARREVQELAGMRRGRVRLGATPSLCAGLLADALARFHARFPGIELHVEESGSRDLIRALGRGELDLALIILPLHSSDPAFVTTPILRESLVVVSSVAAPRPTRQAAMRITDLRDLPLVMFRQGYDVREATLHACRAAGFEPRLAVEGGEMDAVLRFVEAGLGVAVVPSMVLKNRPGLRGIPLAQPRLLRTIALAHRKDVEPSHTAKAFRRGLMNYLAQLSQAELGEDLEVITTGEP
ncbi:LysR family transcriptional regulator [Marinitenerispora sediminis]|uniref:LysR family transcriptional regulator n=1 Tax=Marinitenerispora sediminis TaxID=1931232 RepID=A0A368T930_9ACTN|nr:LysR substrate-binding domain-containing protein [Marinitenerispora sediminis]RCV53593.1 LysR family transcriptional regulator [Marinitenerispora sediminis]RCV55954.1 LysR family transcriptional regulator [Marinitenerispora sediminis]RCV60678.1 LysR family transcriptional regulator [Marinitenerispora sediminis]